MAYSKGCQDVYDEVFRRVKSEGGTTLKASNYAKVAADNCQAKGKGDPPDKKDK